MHQPVDEPDILHFYDPGYGVGYYADDQLLWGFIVKCETACVFSKIGLNEAAGVDKQTEVW